METTAGKSRILLLVVVISFLFALTAAVVIFSLTSLKNEGTGSQKEMIKLFDSGEPEEALKELDRLPSAKRGTSESLLWYGKSWYLKAWKTQHENRWRDYGKNSKDWFEGSAVDESVHYLKRAAADTDTATAAEATFYLALIYLQKGWYEKSEKTFIHLFSLNTTHREGILNYGVLKSRMEQYVKAEKILLKGLEIYPDEAEYFKNLFWIYDAHLKNYEKAVSYGDQYLKLAERGDVGALRVRSEMIDLLARFPEYYSDTLQLKKTQGKQFIPRKRRRKRK